LTISNTEKKARDEGEESKKKEQEEEKNINLIDYRFPSTANDENNFNASSTEILCH
jgi:hypothetical protein